jgi:multiple sugar transport system ATP-binding protein
MTMGDRVAVLKDGVLQQVGTPRELYDRPRNAFVAGFIGSPAMNLLTAPVVEGGVRLGGVVLPVERTVLAGLGGERRVTLGLRPESLVVSDVPTGLPMHVQLVEELGADAYLHGTVQHDGTEERVVVRVDGRRPPAMGATVQLAVTPGEAHFFHPGTGQRLD